MFGNRINRIFFIKFRLGLFCSHGDRGRVSSRILSGVALPTKNALLLAFPEVFAAGAIGKFLTKVLAIGIIK